MTTTCPKCRHIRQPHEDAPAWQCTKCGVAYAKAGDAAKLLATPRSVSYQGKPERGFTWGKWLAVAAIAYGAWAGYQVSVKKHGGGDDGISSLRASLSGGTLEADLRLLAAGVKPGDVTMYTTTECPYCAQTKDWLRQYGFAFAECDAQARPECASELHAHGGMGVPFLMVKGAAMKNGFDSDEFVALLKR